MGGMFRGTVSAAHRGLRELAPDAPDAPDAHTQAALTIH